jgi:type VI secretion system protein ImpH
MASPSRGARPGLEDLLFDKAYGFDFFQAVRLLVRMYREREHVGGDAMPSREVVRFHAHQSMEFPASQIQNAERPAGATSPAAMTVAFMGLTGPLGVLPWHYTELLIKLRLERHPALEEFLDLFNHRLISLFYRAWEKHRFFISYERSDTHRDGRDCDNFTQYLFDLIGMGTAGLRGRLAMPDTALLRYAGLVTQRPHSATALRGILRDYFGMPVVIEQFSGKWFQLDESGLSRLGNGGPQNQLGIGAVAGDGIWNPQARFRIVAGPVSISRFIAFRPDGDAFRALVELVRFFAGQTLDFELQVVLKAAEVPESRLSDEGSDAPRLGWMSWLKADESVEDARDAVFACVPEVARA